MMNLSELLHPESISVDLQATEKDDAIREMISILDKAYPGQDIPTITRAVFAREELISTGIGNGIAIPHAKVEGVDSMMFALGLKKAGLDFRALDDMPVSILFMVIAPSNPEAMEQHLKVMAKISRVLKNPQFCQILINCGSADEVIEKIAREESRFL